MGMHHKVLSVLGDARFHELLLAFDRDLAASVRAGGCPQCHAVLHSASFARKPRGAGCALGPEHYQRLSLCCAKEGCRKRVTPPSLRFLGRRVYLGAAVILISAMRCGSTPARVRELQKCVGVSRRTLSRWRRWWREVFVQSAFWRASRASFMPPVEQADLPASLLVRFTEETEHRLLQLLRFLTPITSGT